MSELLLLAHVAGHAVAVRSASVESVVDLGPVTPTPRAARHVLGLATLRSRVVTVIDTAAALAGEPPQAAPRRAIVSSIDGHHYAFAVDALDDVAEFAPQPLAQGIVLDGGWASAATAMIERGGEPVLLVDLAAIVAGLAGGGLD
jgi:purine-binding chemotaxis protein CheW